MELIIKPTGRCNFCCDFCSAANMDIKHPDKVPSQIKEYIEKTNPSTIIVTGGDPLMVEPEYYYELHSIAPHAIISPTTNLKGFYLNPDKWTKLFNECWFYITTSFNFGDARKWDKNTPFTVDMFKDVMKLYRSKVNKMLPMFIAVIDENNEDTVLDHVLLAKELGTSVKLNGVLAIGKNDKTYPRYKMFRHYINIIELGLEKYEANCRDRKFGKCPINTQGLCGSTIRSCYVDTHDKLHIGRCEDELVQGIEVPEDEIFEPIHQVNPIHDAISPNCATCELFNICNGCRFNRSQAKKDPNYCHEMKLLEDKIIQHGWRL